MQRSITVELIPASVYQGMRQMGINQEQIARFDPELQKKVSLDDLAYWKSIANSPIAAALGMNTSARTIFDGQMHHLLQYNAAQYQQRFENECSGEMNGQPPFMITQLSANSIGVIVTEGATECLKLENNVLAVLTALVQKVLDILEPSELMRCRYSFVQKFMLLSAHINPNRPPQAVFA